MQLEESKRILSGLIKKQLVILGPNVALSTARKVSGVEISDDGDILSYDDDKKHEEILQKIVEEYSNLSGQITKSIFNTLIKENQ